MSIYFRKPSGGFTALPNATITDTSLSLQARALLAVILAGAYRGIDLTLDSIAAEAGISRSAAGRLIDELTTAGYARREGKTLDITSVAGDYTNKPATTTPRPTPATTPKPAPTTPRVYTTKYGLPSNFDTAEYAATAIYREEW